MELEKNNKNLKDNIFYITIFILSLAIIITNRAIVGFSNIIWIADFATIFGVLNVTFTAKHTVWGLIFNAISSSIIVATSLIQKIYLNAGVTLLISIPLLLWGVITWKKNERNNEDEKNLKVLDKKHLIYILIGLAIADAIFTVILYFLNGTLFYLDALLSSFCLIGIFLSSKMYVEQFYFFIFGNVFGITLYSILSVSNFNNISYVLMFSIQLIVMVRGLFYWKKLLRERNESK